jgi:hypothetical protein
MLLEYSTCIRNKEIEHSKMFKSKVTISYDVTMFLSNIVTLFSGKTLILLCKRTVIPKS